MPIRFRCVYCNQLLGISRRKAGTVVRCTTCEGQLIVPDPSSAETEFAGDQDVKPVMTEPAKPKSPAGEAIFEQSDFDAVLEPFQVNASPAVVAKAPAPSSSAKRAVASSSSAIAPNPTAGVVLSRRHITIAAAAIVLGLGLAFAAGLWLGLSMR